MEQFANVGSATLNNGTALTSGAATTVVASRVNIPAAGTFRVLIDQEIVKVTAVSGTTWTLVRGDGGTTAASHADGATAYLIVTKEALDALVSIQAAGTEVSTRRVLNFTGATVTDNAGQGRCDIAIAAAGAITSDTTANTPGSPANGDVFFPTDSPIVQVRSGGVWASFGPIFKLTPPLTTGWTQVGYGTNTTDTKDVDKLVIVDTGAAASQENVRGLFRSVPGSTPYSITTLILPTFIPGMTCNWGLMWRNSSTTKLQAIALRMNGGSEEAHTWEWNNPNSFNGDQANGNPWPDGARFLRLRNDGTNLTFALSGDGVNFAILQTTALGSSWTGTPDQVGIFINPFTSGKYMAVTVPHWLQGT